MKRKGTNKNKNDEERLEDFGEFSVEHTHTHTLLNPTECPKVSPLIPNTLSPSHLLLLLLVGVLLLFLPPLFCQL